MYSEDQSDEGLDIGWAPRKCKLLNQVGSSTLHFVDGQRGREGWDLPRRPAQAQTCPATTEDRPGQPSGTLLTAKGLGLEVLTWRWVRPSSVPPAVSSGPLASVLQAKSFQASVFLPRKQVCRKGSCRLVL